MSSHAVTTQRHRAETDSAAFWKVGVMLLGFLVAALGLAAILMWADAHDSRAKASAKRR